MRLRAQIMVALFLAAGLVNSRGFAATQKFSVAGLENDQEVETFFLAFKDNVAKDARQAVAAMLAYPIGVSLASGQRLTIRNRTQFLHRYNAIFDRTFKEFLQQAKVDDLWAKWQGVATPGGEIWIKGLVNNLKKPQTHKLKIVTINGVVYKPK